MPSQEYNRHLNMILHLAIIEVFSLNFYVNLDRVSLKSVKSVQFLNTELKMFPLRVAGYAEQV